MKGLKHNKSRVHKLYVALLTIIPIKWNQTQLDNLVAYLIQNGHKYKNKNVRYSRAESLGRIAMKLNSQQFKNTVKCLMNGINNDKENPFVQKYCAYSLERVLPKMKGIWKC
ncbi:hypothetical protein RFI_32778 [Reticulomyxa filosa]|uniref:HEAT repeat domain-containing protein n=1 Tax=Reticulomyxa filosa TaxID=46433 RepID=X6LV59_RETFI|nr:hypothetical protein RFI_32778 [Reticulomyxa filosa]|eukprot:ETO04615.1 hypothetical protein RFI_32778 [Reticulomyxa filosa]